MELNTMQSFWQKGSYSPFWILASRDKKKKPKMSLKRLHEYNKFFILDGTKHDPKNFGSLYFITPK